MADAITLTVLFRDSQQAMASDNKADPPILATSMAALPSKETPINIEASLEGAMTSPTPARASIMAVTFIKFFIRKSYVGW